MATFFSTEWEETQEAGTPRGPLTRLSNDKVGVFYRTADAIDRRETSESEFVWKALPLIHEATIAKRPYGFCRNDEKGMMGALSVREGKTTPIATTELLNDFPRRISDRIDRILLNFFRAFPQYGAPIDKLSHLDFFSYDGSETPFFFELMKKRGYLNGNIAKTLGGGVTFNLPIFIGADGWQRIEDIERGVSTQQVFVAMSFDESMHPIYEKIDSAVRSLDLIPVNIGLKEHNNDIVDEIQYEIKRSRFIIADVTQQKHGVYYEAGYAMGHGIPVIWMCKKDEMSLVHFDTNHYSHIVWENGDDLYDKLISRIKGTILA